MKLNDDQNNNDSIESDWKQTDEKLNTDIEKKSSISCENINENLYN